MTAAAPEALGAVVLDAASVSGRALRVSVLGATLKVATGQALALVGALGDGPGALLAILAGAERASRGRVLAFGADPTLGARALAYVPLDPVLPEGLRGRELLDLARGLRGGGARSIAPEAFGVDALLDRDTRRMSREERRALLAFEALSSPDVRAILIDEPLAAMTPAALAALPRALRDARARAAIVLATAAPADARALADAFAVMRAGRVVSLTDALDPLATLGAHGVQLRLVCADPRPIAAALAGDERVTELHTEEGGLVVRGADPARVAGAVQQAIARSDVAIDALRLDALPLAALQSAATAAELAARAPAPAYPMPGPLSARAPYPAPAPTPAPAPALTPAPTPAPTPTATPTLESASEPNATPERDPTEGP